MLTWSVKHAPTWGGLCVEGRHSYCYYPTRLPVKKNHPGTAAHNQNLNLIDYGITGDPSIIESEERVLSAKNGSTARTKRRPEGRRKGMVVYPADKGWNLLYY